MSLIKVKFLKMGEPSGREYTYRSEIPVEVGDTVELPHAVPVMGDVPYSQGVVTQIYVPESEIEAFKDRVKTIIGKVNKAHEINVEGNLFGDEGDGPSEDGHLFGDEAD